MIIGSKFYRLSEVDSTNEYLKRIIKDAPEGTVVLADIQTAGKGRNGRHWYSPEGGIWMSVVLNYRDSCLMPLAAGVAICEAFEPYEIALNIKWPNDIMLNGKKVAGVLAEIVDDRMILGIGINLNVKQFPDDLMKKASSVLIEAHKHLDAQDLFHALYRSIDMNYRLLEDERIDKLLAKWRRYSIMIGRSIKIEQPDRIVVGTVLDVDRQGALIVMRDDCSTEHMIAGDCTLLN